MRFFHHINVKSVNRAIKLLRKYEGRAKLIAGGTDLLGTLKDRILPEYPEAIINLKTIPGLYYIKEDTKGLKIGALARLADIAKSPMVRGKYRLLAEAAQSVATPQIRNMSTIGGNLCQDVRCWYYRYPHHVGGKILCYLKGGKGCYALTGENQYNSIFGASRVTRPPCSSYCPGTADIPSYLNKLREGDLREAARILIEANPFPSITGRVCPHFCEQGCYRGEIDESVSIRASERFMGDYVLENADEILKPAEIDTGKSVAIVGSGPAGLSAAYYLRISGHRVTVYERMDEAGGMLTYGIPAYRLPKDIVRRVVKILQYLGVKFELNVDVGKEVTLRDLRKDFDNLFLASGAWRQQSIGLKGEELTQSGLEFLINLNRGIKEIPGTKVLVIGGGNVAVDVGITALRLGAEEVTLACLESREAMPALKWEIEQAIEEGVALMPSWGPSRVLESNGKVKGAELVRCMSVFDNEGSFAPTFNDGVKERVEADRVIMAVGQTTDLAFIDPEWPLKIDRGLIGVDPETQETDMPGVFAGGEITSGPATVIEAIAAGKRAAVAIDLHLKGAGAQTEDKDEKTIKSFLKFNSEYFKRTTQVKMPRLPVPERGIDVEDALGLSLNEIETEANRCFNCGCVAVNCSDVATALIALDAKIKIEGPKGTRTILAEDFFITLGSGLKPYEIVTEIQVPQPLDRAKQTFLKFRLRHPIDFAIASVASVITFEDGVCKDGRIVLGAVAPIPIRATKAEETIMGKAIDDRTANEAAEAAVSDALPLTKNGHKVEITKALIKRVILSNVFTRNRLSP
jgi:NADPH-dependent glutamate synthase beta subunit-like oxidoreductase/CO/xanthine dehydrogenase FAD-binding subunit